MIKNNKRQDPVYQAQDILARRDHSEYEVRVKLGRKGFSPQQIDDTITKLTQAKLLDDEKFAIKFVANTLQFKKVGPRWLIHKLQEKRVATEIIEPAVYQFFDDTKEERLATEAAEAWCKSHARYARDPERLTRFLISRGFSYEAATKAIDNVKA